MLKTNNHYYDDSRYQLELNLQAIRKELIVMLDDFEKNDCTACKQLKCRCPESKPAAKSDSGGNSQASCKSPHSRQDLNASKEAPPADVLPQPKFDEKDVDLASSTPEKPAKDIEAWVRAVTTKQSLHVPEYKRCEIDNDFAFKWSRMKSTWDKKSSLALLGNINGVEAFFRSFKNPPLTRSAAQTNVSYMSNKLAAAFKMTSKKPYEYTYF